MSFTTLITCFLAMGTTGWAQYVLEDDYMSGGNFFDKFAFWDSADPTNGFVNYQGESASSSQDLINSSSTNVQMRVDSTNQAPNGRASVRITSTKSYNSGLFILDADHMPTGCGTWPAFWLVGPNWPNEGEIDIIEGVNEQATNAMTLHTKSGCSITDNNVFSGAIVTDNCDVNASGQDKNAGCSIKTEDTQSYGSGFNDNNGGVYATEWTSSAISVYFFPRGSIPSDITSGSPMPSSWGKPLAQFQGGCDIPDFFSEQQIVFDTTFCGDWAGAVWSSGSCASKADTCNAFVADNPSAFTDAFWSINALKVYQSGGSTSSKVESTTAWGYSSSLSAIEPTSTSLFSHPNHFRALEQASGSYPIAQPPCHTTLLKRQRHRFTLPNWQRFSHRHSTSTIRHWLDAHCFPDRHLPVKQPTRELIRRGSHELRLTNADHELADPQLESSPPLHAFAAGGKEASEAAQEAWCWAVVRTLRYDVKTITM
ncbi:hypothetical protein LTR27_005369 [Elasticomyces elasticus]|nr:hypothetical protein LTR27_005369 [Elasticomyces elasticus]